MTGPANDALPWDDFDTEAYLDQNYRILRDDDAEIIGLVRDFFGAAGIVDGAGIDVGTGANLYPLMTMLPFCRKITAWERSATNVRWLRAEVRDYAGTWDAFWRPLADHAAYQHVCSPRSVLARRVDVRHSDMFALPAAWWDIGTMFFVAESMSGVWAEFERGLRLFVRSLRGGAPFAVAFMENSQGYRVGRHWFPAVPVRADDIKGRLADLAHGVVVHEIRVDTPLRDGYDGMILAVGRAGRGR